MPCYRDRTYCSMSYMCRKECSKKITKEEIDRAENEVHLPVAYADYHRSENCTNKYLKNRFNKS